MIYKKDAAFPYPILSNASNSYQANYFEFDIDQLIDSQEEYIFQFSYTISSSFIEKLIKEDKAKIVFIIQAGDNSFFLLENNCKEIRINKNRISLNNRTKIQLQIQTSTEINFSEADDLSEFYLPYKKELFLKKKSLLGYSNEVIYEGSDSKPLDLFEQKIDPNITESVKVCLQSETILLVYKDRDYALDGNDFLGINKNIKNMYLYLGLNRALEKIIQIYGQNDGYVDLDSLGNLESGLEIKLVDLMINKNIKELAYDNIDEVIQKISDKLIEKYVISMKGMISSGN